MTTPVFILAGFTDDQRKVLSALAKGETLTAAAQSVGVHRNTIQYWRQKNQHFKEAVDNARQAFRASMQVEYEELASECLDGMRELIRDKSTPPGVRLKAYLAVLNHVVKEPLIELPSAAPASWPVPQPINFTQTERTR